MNTFKQFKIAFILTAFFGCTDLEPEVFDRIDGDVVVLDAADQLIEDTTLVKNYLSTSYNQLYQYLDEREIFALTEVTTDEMVVPTRGTDWSDNGLWIQLHEHSWNPDHEFIQSAWDGLSRGVARSFEVKQLFTDFIRLKPELTDFLVPYNAELDVLLAYYSWQYIDLFGVLPTLNDQLSPVVLSRSAGTQWAIDLLERAIVDLYSKEELPEYGRVVKESAHALLAKIYLNRFIYEGLNAPTSDDMSKVILNADAVINSGSYQLAGDYFSMFEAANETSPESLLVIQNQDNLWNYAHTTTRNLMTLHYNQQAGVVNYAPWNGMCTTEEFFNTWDDDQNPSNGVTSIDTRFNNGRYNELFGFDLGMLFGQQYDPSGTMLNDRNGNPLSFTAIIGNIRQASEIEGVRVIKWAPDDNSPSPFQADNDVALLRFADVVLVKAEALWRMGNTEEALNTLNELRIQRGANPLGSLSAEGNEILRERGLELYWEGHRRTDLIRFDRFTKGTWFAKQVSPDHYSIFPIPTKALAANSSLTQNTGY
ncbi:MAG: RagB/SusD family nutrient uptake outer membrane protein [Cyclobacteriaceae bacterium]